MFPFAMTLTVAMTTISHYRSFALAGGSEPRSAYRGIIITHGLCCNVTPAALPFLDNISYTIGSRPALMDILTPQLNLENISGLRDR